MERIDLIAIGVLIAAPIYAMVAPFLRRQLSGRHRSVARFARRLRKPVPAAIQPRVEQQLATSYLGADFGGAAGAMVGAAWMLAVGQVIEPAWGVLIMFTTMLAGVAIGSGAAALREASRPRDPEVARIARATTPTVADYVAPIERQGARAVCVLPVMLLGVAIGLRIAGVATAPLAFAVGAAVLSVGALVFAELGVRRVVAAPQAAQSETELLFSDALRAHTLRAIITVPITVGTYVSVGVLATFGLERIDADEILGIAVVLGLMLLVVAGLVAVAWTLTGAPHRYVLTRLWPTDPVQIAPRPETGEWTP